MTEAKWLACTHPLEMLGHFDEQMCRRKARLLACACCRRLWAVLSRSSQDLLSTAERYADWEATKGELPANLKAAHRLDTPDRAVALTAYRHAGFSTFMEAIFFAGGVMARGRLGFDYWKALADERAAQALIVRDIFGPLPFRPVTIDAAWRSWNHGIVPALARRIYEVRAYSELPILADALEDAGCTYEDILTHCRSEGPHSLGCWVVDAILGK